MGAYSIMINADQNATFIFFKSENDAHSNAGIELCYIDDMPSFHASCFVPL